MPQERPALLAAVACARITFGIAKDCGSNSFILGTWWIGKRAGQDWRHQRLPESPACFLWTCMGEAKGMQRSYMCWVEGSGKPYAIKSNWTLDRSLPYSSLGVGKRTKTQNSWPASKPGKEFWMTFPSCRFFFDSLKQSSFVNSTLYFLWLQHRSYLHQIVNRWAIRNGVTSHQTQRELFNKNGTYSGKNTKELKTAFWTSLEVELSAISRGKPLPAGTGTRKKASRALREYIFAG